MLFAAIAAGATVLTLAMPLLATETLGKRMKAVAIEREKIRQRERDRLAQGSKGVVAADRRSSYMQGRSRISTSPNGSAQEAARDKLVQAGYRGQAPYVTLPVLPHGDADRAVPGVGRSTCS